MPAIAAVTLLTKLENDIRQAESEALTNLITNVDISDVRVNSLDAYVIPNSKMVMRGDKYSANIVLAAIDTTQRPTVFVNGSKLPNDKGLLELNATTVGTHDYSGYIEVMKGDGSIDRREFKSSYTVMEPMATISPTLMNVLYAGIDNPISISVPGFPMNAIQATMTNGTLTRSGDSWIARPQTVGSEAVISVTANTDGAARNVGSMTFRVRKLPDPTPYIPIKDAQGNVVHYKGSPKKISKAALMAAESLGAAIDDDILNVTYTVVSFSTVFFDSMGNAIPEVSDGASFSRRQKEQFKRLKPGKNFFITDVKAKGPDGITRDISPSTSHSTEFKTHRIMTLNKTILTIILLLSGLSLHAQVENAGGVRKRSEKEKKGVQGGPVISDRMQGFLRLRSRMMPISPTCARSTASSTSRSLKILRSISRKT